MPRILALLLVLQAVQFSYGITRDYSLENGVLDTGHGWSVDLTANTLEAKQHKIDPSWVVYRGSVAGKPSFTHITSYNGVSTDGLSYFVVLDDQDNVIFVRKENAPERDG